MWSSPAIVTVQSLDVRRGGKEQTQKEIRNSLGKSTVYLQHNVHSTLQHPQLTHKQQHKTNSRYTKNQQKKTIFLKPFFSESFRLNCEKRFPFASNDDQNATTDWQKSLCTVRFIERYCCGLLTVGCHSYGRPFMLVRYCFAVAFWIPPETQDSKIQAPCVYTRRDFYMLYFVFYFFFFDWKIQRIVFNVISKW